MSDNCNNLPPDYPGYSGDPGYPNPYALGTPGNPLPGGDGGSGGGGGGGIGEPTYSGAPGFDGLPKKSFIDIEQLKSTAAEQDFNRSYAQNRAEQNRLLLQDKRNFFGKKRIFESCIPVTIRRNNRKRRTCRCPVCHPLNRVRDKVVGKNYIKIPFTNFKIPRWDHLIDIGKSFDGNRRKGEVCGACRGRKYIEDITDDSEAYSEVAQKISQKAEDIMKAEAKLGLGGTRTTVIQGSDLLFVGLGFNNNVTHEVIPGGAIAPSLKGGKIPQQNGTPVNAVVGKQGSLAWPQQVGNYTIKCANKFSLLAGAGGITIATPGPLTFSAGMMKFVGPQLALGSSTGPLTLEGDSVNITGKTISITPTGGELFVKGNISNTGNVTSVGHAHFESVSFVKGICAGATKSTFIGNANPDNTITQPAIWWPKSIVAALLDLQTYYTHILSDTKTSAFRLLSPQENLNISDRLASLTKLSLPLEFPLNPLPTGYLIPGTPITVAGTCPCNFGGIAGGVITGSILAPVPLYNVPHTHGLPEMQHSHDVVLPDMDYTSSSARAVRSKVMTGMQESGVPANPTKDTVSRLGEIVRTTIEFGYNMATQGIKLASKFVRLK